MKERNKLPEPQQKAIMGYDNHWTRVGRREGRQEGMVELMRELLASRLGALSLKIDEQLEKLSTEQLRALLHASSDFGKQSDLEQWLKSQTV